MRDYKADKPPKVKGNRRKRSRQPWDWRKVLQRGLGVGLLLAKLSLVVLLVGGVVLAGRAVFHSGYFGVAQVQVEGLKRLTSDEVVGLSDLRTGENIFDLDLEAIGRKIEENPWVASAEVRRVFPREVLIKVVERRPVAVINLGYLYYVGAGGEIFKVLDGGDRLDYPAITGFDRQFLLDNPAEAHRLLQQAVGLLAELAKRRVFSLREVSELHVSRDDGLALFTTSGGVPIKLGFAGYAGKLDRLERIFPQLRGRLAGLKSIDLNVADRVIVQLDTRLSRNG